MWGIERAKVEEEWGQRLAKAVAAAEPEDGAVAAMLGSMATEHQAALAAQQAAAEKAAAEREASALAALADWEAGVSEWEAKVAAAEAAGMARLEAAAAEHAQATEAAAAWCGQQAAGCDGARRPTRVVPCQHTITAE